MSVKFNLLAAGILLLVFAAIGYFHGEGRYKSGRKDAVNSITQDSIEIRIDTVKIPYPDPFPVYLERTIDADIDTSDNIITYSTHIDSTVIIDGDTVAVINLDISLTEAIFKILMSIELRPVEFLVALTRTEFRTVPVFIPADPPFYNTFWFGSVFATLTLLLTALLL